MARIFVGLGTVAVILALKVLLLFAVVYAATRFALRPKL
jgi:hypothetical protein